MDDDVIRKMSARPQALREMARTLVKDRQRMEIGFWFHLSKSIKFLSHALSFSDFYH